ncbi:MlaE family lipid ABC transporter permease subunit [Sandarakinorhabdus sp.]|uniref:ABC transporter permease n=1 Tax=Sandarakinorhabdus sp. TaxID=1916663 RepID=UPI00333E5352
MVTTKPWDVHWSNGTSSGGAAEPSVAPLGSAEPSVTVSGRLTLDAIMPLDEALRVQPPAGPALAIDLSGVTGIDTAGAWAIAGLMQRWQGAGIPARLIGASPDVASLVGALANAPLLTKRRKRGQSVIDRLERIGRSVTAQASNTADFVAFLGQVLVVLGLTLIGRRPLRGHAVIHQAEAIGVNALGIVGLLLFLVGLVVAQQGAVQLRQFGAEVFTVNLIGRSTSRELGILLAAIMVAGRSGSAFAAQIGSMKLNQEIDALRTIGLDPIEVLVIPRVIACSLMMLGLAFYGILCALVAGGLFVWLQLDMPPGTYVQRLQEVTPLSDFVIGMVKAPVFGFIIALMGCFHGFNVTGNAESVGARTTQAVVESIFVVIVFDALFAFFFSSLGYN